MNNQKIKINQQKKFNISKNKYGAQMNHQKLKTDYKI